MTTYSIEQLGTERPERSREVVLFELVGMVIEQMWAIDDYILEPDDLYEA